MKVPFKHIGKKLISTVLITLFCSLCLAQNTAAKSDFWRNVNFYGGIGVNFSNGGFNGSISPGAIYQFNEIVGAGLGANVNFFKQNDSKFWAYGPSAIILVNPIKQIQLSFEYETLRVNSSLETNGINFEQNFWSDALFLGIGYRTNYATVGFRYNVIYDESDSIYLNALVPFVRFNF